MTVALSALALLGLLGGHFWITDSHFWQFWHAPHTWFETSATIESLYAGTVHAHHADHHVEHTAHLIALSVSPDRGAARDPDRLPDLRPRLGPLPAHRRRDHPHALGEAYHTVANKYYVDEMVHATVIKGSMLIARVLSAFDKYVIDGIVNLCGTGGRAVGNLSAWFDRTFVDGAVNGAAALSQAFGSVVRLLQSGRVQQYAAFAVGGGMLVAVWVILL